MRVRSLLVVPASPPPRKALGEFVGVTTLHSVTFSVVENVHIS